MKALVGTTCLIIFGIVIIAGIICTPFYLWPKYNIYRAEMKGTAEVKQAELNRRILVFEAEAKKDSAKLYAEAEIERAKGVAEANNIIGKSLRDNENYLRWLWISELSNTQNQVIYVPTEAGLPILEAGKR